MLFATRVMSNPLHTPHPDAAPIVSEAFRLNAGWMLRELLALMAWVDYAAAGDPPVGDNDDEDA